MLVRPSYVLGGRAMQIVYDRGSLRELLRDGRARVGRQPVLIDRFLEDAYEVDVDAIARRRRAYVIGGVMQHIEDAGIHSGDSACVLPPYIIREEDLATMRAHTLALAKALGVVGLINVQFAIQRPHRLRARGESAREPHDAVHLEGDRRAAGVASRRG